MAAARAPRPLSSIRYELLLLFSARPNEENDGGRRLVDQRHLLPIQEDESRPSVNFLRSSEPRNQPPLYRALLLTGWNQTVVYDPPSPSFAKNNRRDSYRGEREFIHP